jgi:serine protease Do
MNGNVIGINTAILGQSGSRGIGFSIPSNSAKKVVDQLIKYGETKRGWLGVRIQIVTKEIADIERLGEPKGALVASVAENSPSDKAKIKAGDIILEFNGIAIKEMKELPKIVAQAEVGKLVDVKVWRNKKEVIKKIKLGRLETADDFVDNSKKTETIKELEIKEIKSLKIAVRVLNKKDIADRKLPNQSVGLVIVGVATDSPINYLKVNDIIIEAQKKKLRSAKDLESIVESALNSSEKTILIVIYNNQNQRRYIGVKLD